MSINIKNATGSTTLVSTSGTNDTVTLPSAAGTLLNTDGDGSSLTSLTGSQVDGGEVTAKAWLSLNGATFGINDSYNVSSVTDEAVGQYQVNFTTALDSANYAATLISDNSHPSQWVVTLTTAKYNIRLYNGSAFSDAVLVNSAVFGG